jgi:uncharacterized membrane protein
MISPDNSFGLWAILLISALFGMYGERKGWFKKVSGALMTIIFAAVLTSIGLIPNASDSSIEVPTYDFVFTYFIPFSIPLLLFRLDLRKIIRESGRLLIIYLISAAGVVAGALLALFIIDLGPETYKIVSVFIGTYIGGSVNFMAVAATFDFLRSSLFPSVIAVDNVYTYLYIMLLFYIPFFGFLKKYYPELEPDEEDEVDPAKEELPKIPGGLLEAITVCLLISGLICWSGTALSGRLMALMQTDINLDMLVITALIVIVANVFPKWLQQYDVIAFDLGMFLLYLFLAVIGASCDLRLLFTSIPGILLMASIILTVQLVVSMLVGKWLKFSLKEIMIACCANAAGPSVTAPMAITFKMRKAVTPAILISILGYLIGTFIGVGVGVLLQ